MEYLLVGLFLIGYFILSIKRLDWAVFVILATLPSYQIRFQVAGIPFTLLEVMILTAFAVWLLKNYKEIINNFRIRLKRKTPVPSKVEGIHEKRSMKLTRYPFDIEIALVLIFSWVAVAVAGFSDAALGIWKAYFFEPVLLFILIFNVYGHASQKYIPRLRSATAPPSKGDFMVGFNKVLWALTVSAFWVSLVAIVERLTGWFAVEAFWPRVTGPFPYPNALGLYLGSLVLLMVGWAVAVIARRNDSDDVAIPSKMEVRETSGSFTPLRFVQDDRFRMVFIGAAILMSVVAIILARSEGAAVGILAGGFVIAVLWLKERMKKKIYSKIILGGLVLILVIISFYPVIVLNVYPKYYHPTFKCEALNYVIKKTALKDLSGEIRKQQWRETWEMLKDGPTWLLGTGLSNYQAKIEPYHQEGIFFNFENDPDFRQKIVWWDEKYKAQNWQPVEIYMYPHNTVLNFWTELGLLGALIFVWIIGRYFIIAYRVSHNAYRENTKQKNYFIVLGLIGAMVVVVVHGMVDVVYFKNDLAVIFWVLLAILGIHSIREKKIEK